MERLKKHLKRYEKTLLSKKNVVGVATGYKTVNGEKTGSEAIIVFVEKKIPESQLKKKDIIPKTLGCGVLTDVVETGKFRALNERKEKMRPAKGGISIGHYKITAGTLGCIVYYINDSNKENPLILSNNHVLANSNNANIGDPIYQPGPYDCPPMAETLIGKLESFIPIQFSGENSLCSVSNAIVSFLNTVSKLLKRKSRFNVYSSEIKYNLVDCALCKPLNPDMVSEEILEVGIPNGISEAELGMHIFKSGRTTGLTEGTIEYVNATIQVDYNGKTAYFTEQIIAKGKNNLISSGGDSGSVVLTENNLIIGLLFAGNDSQNILVANKIQNVFSKLNIKI